MQLVAIKALKDIETASKGNKLGNEGGQTKIVWSKRLENSRAYFASNDIAG